MVRIILGWAFGVLILPLTAGCQHDAPVGEAELPDLRSVTLDEVEPPLAELLDRFQLEPASIRFHVDKSDRTFSVLVGDERLRTYPCVLGERPVGDKFHQGDRRTPEGTFMFRSKRVHSAWHKFIWLDYPNAESWKRFNTRRAAGLIPAGRDIGGEVGIHGVPEGHDDWIDLGEDWTWGCIALKNHHVDEIYPYVVPMRTTITIVP